MIKIHTKYKLIGLSLLLGLATSSFAMNLQDDNQNSYEFTLQHGTPEEQYTLGDAYFIGNGVEKNDSKAFNLYTAAADGGNKDAQCMLGRYYQEGNSVKKDLKKAIELYQKAVQQESKEALFFLGDAYREENNIIQAIKYYKLATKKGPEAYIYKACLFLGHIYREGNGVKKDPQKALKYYKRAVENKIEDDYLFLGNDFLDAYVFLGHAYLHGSGVKKDPQEALTWYLKAAEKNNKEAQFNLGIIYINNKNIQEGIEWLTKSADQGYISAQFFLGVSYLAKNKTIEYDVKKGIKYLILASKAGDINAVVNILSHHTIIIQGITDILNNKNSILDDKNEILNSLHELHELYYNNTNFNKIPKSKLYTISLVCAEYGYQNAINEIIKIKTPPHSKKKQKEHKENMLEFEAVKKELITKGIIKSDTIIPAKPPATQSQNKGRNKGRNNRNNKNQPNKGNTSISTAPTAPTAPISTTTTSTMPTMTTSTAPILNQTTMLTTETATAPTSTTTTTLTTPPRVDDYEERQAKEKREEKKKKHYFPTSLPSKLKWHDTTKKTKKEEEQKRNLELLRQAQAQEDFEQTSPAVIPTPQNSLIIDPDLDISRSCFSVTASETEATSMSESILDERNWNEERENAQLMRTTYKHLERALRKISPKAKNITLKSPNAMIETIIALWENGFVTGSISGSKITVTKTGNPEICLNSHTTHGSSKYAKWYQNPAITKSFLIFVAECDPMIATYLNYKFGENWRTQDIFYESDD